MAPTHKQIFWTIDVGTGDIGGPKRAQIAKAALMLQQHHLVVHSSSAGGYDNLEKPEIALTLDIDFEEVPVFKHEIESALAHEGLRGVGVTLEKDIHWFTFNDTNLEALKSSVIDDIDRARESIDDLVCIPVREPSNLIRTNLATELAAILSQFGARTPSESQVTSSKDGGGAGVGHYRSIVTTDFTGTLKAGNGASASSIASSDTTEMMLITEAKYKSMRDARGKDIEGEVNGLKNTLASISTESKTNTQTAIMVAGGMIAVGGPMVTAYAAITAAGSLTAAISAAIATIGGAVVLASIAAVVAAIFLALYVILKDAWNELIVINGLKDKEVKFTKDWIIDGERYRITLNVPASEQITQKPYAYGCGTYTYRKTRWWDVPVGFFGSNAGVAFKAADGTEFSVGVDCPNTATGGTNCIRVKENSDAEGAAMAAASSGYSTETIKVNGHTCIASRASPWGSVNYGICSLE